VDEEIEAMRAISHAAGCAGVLPRDNTGAEEGRRVLRTADLDYELSPERIATHPVHPRDSARLMVVERRTGVASHRRVRDLPEILQPTDLLVFNTTRVLPARFRGERVGTGGRIEGLYLRDAAGESADPREEGLLWVALIKGRHTRAGAVLELHDHGGQRMGARLEVLGRPEAEPEAWLVRVEGAASTKEVLERAGWTPLPPYILKARRDAGDAGDDGTDRAEYQTVFAREPGSVAAPTAGLHFTPELLSRLEAAGVRRAEVVLHVGMGTFRPVETEFVEQHPMHAEWCSMPAETLAAIERTRVAGGRVIPVGTTAARTVESYAAAMVDSAARPSFLETRLLITPGYPFRWTDGLLTNFHLPRSTLLAMVAALFPGDGVGKLKELYAEALAREYRFFSFGDAMLVGDWVSDSGSGMRG
jgi:S-adenosylmethionine:tRNA ribosyltransferase-isomerase